MKIEFKTQADTKHRSFENDFLKLMSDKFFQVTGREDIGFFQLKDAKNHLKSCQEIFEKHQDKKYFIQIGIGGSALGPQMLIDAFGDQSSTKILFMDNTDAEFIKDVLSEIKSPQEALFYVVSKSGGTAETVANFAIAKNFLLNNGIAKSDLNNHFVFCTDAKKGYLREMADQENYHTLEVPNDLGGRFSVLSPVGFFPALFAKIDCDKLITGAHDLRDEINNQKENHNLFLTGAHIAYLQKEMNPSVNQTVLMPYSSKLKNLSHWFVQLWGESLGKFSENTQSNVGLTPVPAYGATDQHSQMQLFMQGPNDKVLILLNVESRTQDFNLNADINMQPAKDLANYTLNQLIKAQYLGTLKALEEMKRNLIHIDIKVNDEYNMGQLIMFFESLTALMGEYLAINAFDQPGVELGKKFAYEYLKKMA
jgi:glucose-6-phosphate isomerase